MISYLCQGLIYNSWLKPQCCNCLVILDRAVDIIKGGAKIVGVQIIDSENRRLLYVSVTDYGKEKIYGRNKRMCKKINKMLKEENYRIRLLLYILGLFIMTLGISMSVKSNLGVSPVSSIPYSITCITGLEMGKATILFHVFLVLLQIVILGKAFKIKNLLQVAAGIIFGYFTTFSNYLFSFLPTPDNIVVRLVLMIGSAVLIAVGIFFYLPADIVPLAGEGAMQAISEKTNFLFSKVKIGFDVTMVAASLAACLIALHKAGAVGIGTIAASILVGTILGRITRQFGEKRDLLLQR